MFLSVVGGLLTSSHPLQAQSQSRASPSTQPSAPEGELPRRALFGARLAPVTPDVRDRLKLDGDDGVVLEQIFPGTSAAEAGFKAGDVILAVDGARVTSVPMFVEKVAQDRAGSVLTVDLVRDGVRSEQRVTLQEMPREQGEGYDVIYGAVTSHGARLRTIVARPRGEGRHPAVMLLQGGHTCFFIDSPVGLPNGFTWISQDLVRHGYVTLRVERPGCGDSEGGPLRDVDFNTELDGYRQALQALRESDFVDADNIFLFGHSMGGIMAPLIAVETPVRGIAVYGTASETWFESVVGQRRRLAALDGTDPAEVDSEVLRQTRFWYALAVDRKTPAEIRAQDPELGRVREQWVADDKYIADRHYTFYHQLADKNLAAAWAKVAGTRLSVGGQASSARAETLHPAVLALWGTSDWLSTRAANAWIAEVVNRTHPGNGTFVALDAIDHSFFRAASPEESYRIWKPATGTPPGEFNPVLLETLRAWLDRTVARAQQRPGDA
jgi:pimeloyl-ACP methyl ester carboxylesterase